MPKAALLTSKFSKLKIASGPVSLIPSRVTERGMFCISSTNLESHKGQVVGFRISAESGSTYQFNALIESSASQSGVFVVELVLSGPAYDELAAWIDRSVTL